LIVRGAGLVRFGSATRLVRWTFHSSRPPIDSSWTRRTWMSVTGTPPPGPWSVVGRALDVDGPALVEVPIDYRENLRLTEHLGALSGA